MTQGLKSNYFSEPAIVARKPPTGPSLPMKLCCASSAESLGSDDGSLMNIQGRAAPALPDTAECFKEPAGRDPQLAIQHHGASGEDKPTESSESILMPPPETPTPKVLSDDLEPSSHPTPKRKLADSQNITFGRMEMSALSPLYIDSALFDTDLYCNPAVKTPSGSLCGAAAGSLSSHHGSTVGESQQAEVQHLNCSKLIDALDIQSPAHFKLGVSAGLQSTPYRTGLDFNDDFNKESGDDKSDSAVLEMPAAQNLQLLFPQAPESQRPRVADHIQHFNKLTLYSPKGSNAKGSPLKFQRTPVRQSVRRINSLLGDSRRPKQGLLLSSVGQSGPSRKSVSMESVRPSVPLQLQPHRGEEPASLPTVKVGVTKKPPPVPPKNPSVLVRAHRVCALGDVTNHVPAKSGSDTSVSKTAVSEGRKTRLQQVTEKDVHHYRGSPRNPLNEVRLLSATKPIDL